MILVTGATGLNGSTAIRDFVRRREPVSALVRSAAKAASGGAAANVEVVEGDMLRPETLGDALDGVDRVRTLLSAGIPPAFADAMDELFRERRKGAESTVNLSTHETLGVRPTTFEEFARRNAAVLRGQTAPSHLWSSG